MRRLAAFARSSFDNGLSVEPVGNDTALVHALVVATALCAGHLFYPAGIAIPEPGNDSFADSFSDNVSAAHRKPAERADEPAGFLEDAGPAIPPACLEPPVSD